MFNIIIYLIIVIGIIHFTLYYFNIDFDVYYNFFNKNKPIDNSISISINECINELKTLNECINNGEINPSFS